MTTHTIYHCPELKKVGCTKDLERRTRQYKGAKLFPLSIITGTAKEAGDEEWWWADYYQYPRGRHYTSSVNGVHHGSPNGGKVTGAKNRDSGRMKELGELYGSIGGKIAGAIARDSGQMSNLGKQYGAIYCATERKCETCGRIIRGPVYFRHIKKCGGAS